MSDDNRVDPPVELNEAQTAGRRFAPGNLGISQAIALLRQRPKETNKYIDVEQARRRVDAELQRQMYGDSLKDHKPVIKKVSFKKQSKTKQRRSRRN